MPVWVAILCLFAVFGQGGCSAPVGDTATASAPTAPPPLVAAGVDLIIEFRNEGASAPPDSTRLSAIAGARLVYLRSLAGGAQLVWVAERAGPGIDEILRRLKQSSLIESVRLDRQTHHR